MVSHNRLKKLLLGMLAAMMLLSAVRAENRALLVGISDYSHPRLNLKGPLNDVQLMKQVALSIGFKENQILILTNKNATRAKLLDAFRNWLLSGVNRGDKVLFYYSGHGTQVPDQSGDEDDGCDEALVPADAVSVGPSAFIPDDSIQIYLNQIKADDILVILDCCYSGTATRGIPLLPDSGEKTGNAHVEYVSYGKMLIKGQCYCNQPVNMKSLSFVENVDSQKTRGASSGIRHKNNIITFTASAQNEIARDAMVPGSASLFTGSLARVLRNSKGPVSCRQLRDRVAKRIREVCKVMNEVPHTPQLEGNEKNLNRDIKSFGFQSGSSKKEYKYKSGILASETLDQFFTRLVSNRSFHVQIKADKKKYRLGEKIHFSIVSSKEGYVNLVEISPAGDAVLLFPNTYAGSGDRSNRIEAWKPLHVPGDIGGFGLVAQPPAGKSRVIVLITPGPLNFFTRKIGRPVQQFRLLLGSDVDQLKHAVRTRAIGVVPAGNRTVNEYGAGQINLEVSGNR